LTAQDVVRQPENQSQASNFASQAKLRKNTLFIDQSAFSNCDLYVISTLTDMVILLKYSVRENSSSSFFIVITVFYYIEVTKTNFKVWF